MNISKFARTSALIFTTVCLAAIAVIQSGSSNAAPAKHWISVDPSELQHISAERGPNDRSGLSKVEPLRLVGDAAILQLNDLQMEELSRSMHDNFHKCGGYVYHTSEAEAIEWVNNNAAARTESQLINYTINNAQSVNTLLPLVRESEIRQTIADLSAFPNRRFNQPSGTQSANWIRDRWAALTSSLARGMASVDFYIHPSSTSPQPSVILTIRGTRYPDEIVVLGAHQDSINSSGSTASAPGADDDASGIACLTEVIRVMVAGGYNPDRTVQFMAYAAEEVGLRGSNAIATAYRNENKNVVGVLQLDMTNFRGTQGFDIVFITDNTNAAQNQFLRDLITAYQPGLTVGNSTCGYACSDHASWHNKSYPASFPFEAPFNNHNNAIHTANDTLARSNNNANHSVNFTKLSISYIAELAKGCVNTGTRCLPL